MRRAWIAVLVLAGAAAGEDRFVEAEAFVQKLATALTARDRVPFDNALDREGILDRAIAGIPAAKETSQASLAQIKSICELGMEICHGLESYELLRIRVAEGRLRALCRQVKHGVLDYHELQLTPDAKGGFRIDDVYFCRSGVWMSGRLRGWYLMAVAKADKALADKLQGRDSEIVRNLPLIQEFQQDGTADRYAQALESFRALPGSLQKDKEFLAQLMYCSVLAGKEERCVVAAEFAALFPGDPCPDLILLQELPSQQFDEALLSLERLDKAMGGDIYLRFRRLETLMDAGREAEAKAIVFKAIIEEPGLLSFIGIPLERSLRERNHAEMVRLLADLLGRMEMEPPDFSGVDLYKDFVASEEYREWMKSRAKP